MTKRELREWIAQQKKKISSAEKAQQTAELLRRLADHPRFRAAQTVLLFYSLPDEPDTHAFVEQWSQEKTILLPVVVGDDLQLRQFVSSDGMQVGHYGIAEPRGKSVTAYETIDLIVVPGVAFDGIGNRLGRGKGYYDRLLSQPRLRAYKLGFCFDFQKVAHVPTEDFDIRMDEVL